MSFIANTMFESHVSNITRNGTQNVSGLFGTYSASTYSPLDCSAGFLCTPAALTPNSAYAGIQVNNASGTATNILNSNDWYFVQATNGSSALTDHTGIYACNPYDVNKVISGSNSWNLGFETLGLGLPGGQRGNFTEIIIGEEYAFGKGNFSTAPTANMIYATISNGLLVATATLPTGGTGLYFEILRTEAVTEGTFDWGDKYILKAKKTLEVAGS